MQPLRRWVRLVKAYARSMNPRRRKTKKKRHRRRSEVVIGGGGEIPAKPGQWHLGGRRTISQPKI